MKQNKLPWLILGIGVLVVIAISVANSQDEPVVESAQAAQPPLPGARSATVGGDPTDDTSVDTLKTIMAKVERADNRISQFEDSNSAVEDLKSELARVQSQLRAIRSHNPASTVQETTVASLAAVSKINDLVDSAIAGESPVKVLPESVAYPVNVPPASSISGGYQTLTPLIGSPEKPEGQGLGAIGALGSNSPLAQVDDTPLAKPFYTLHPGSTIFDAAAMTALIGRVPVGGQVSDPVETKFVVGAENFAANGHLISGISGAIFTGQVVGDWTLSCVQVVLKSASFVFPDGRIRTVPDTKGGSGGELKGIGYITDPNGNCVRGTRITDRDMRAGWSFAGGLAEGFAEALAAEQTTTTTSPEGSSTTSVDGDKKRYQLGSAVSQGISDTRASYEQLWGDAFDIVYAPPGTKVVLHINEQLEIDYETQGRKVVYQDRYRSDALD